MSSSPASSRTAPVATMSAATNITSSPQAPALAFFNHSPDTLHQSNASNADQSVARQKRKRTSKEDEEILKTEFRRNPKPDKATRMEIVSKVAMGEKEVQIWFQNRRQNERRRARSFLGSDGLQDRGADVVSSDPAWPSSSQASGSSETQPHTSSQSDAPAASQTSHASDIENTSLDIGSSSVPASSSESRPSTAIAIASSSAVTQPETSSFSAPSSSQPPISSQDNQLSSAPRAGYLANRRSASFVRLADDEPSVAFPEIGSVGQPSRAASGLRRTHSLVRLSMTADGQARVVTNDDQSPSPPRPRQIPDEAAARTGSLRRSYSAVGLEDSPSAEIRPARRFRYSNASLGRSRDSRAWEFWCDSDARNSLTDKADQEGSGSAADAIGLIRANSRGVLRPLANKANTPTQSPASKPGRSGNAKARPAMARSHTSSGRLQTHSVKQSHLAKPTCEKIKESDSGDVDIPNNDSDKENWEPGITRASNASPYSKPAADDRRKRQRRESSDQQTDAENAATPDDEEIAQFMGGAGSAHASISNGEELGCVEGLLKLSRGGWR